VSSDVTVKWTVDRRQLAVEEVRKAAAEALFDAGHFLEEEANRTVPLEEGTLQRSSTVSVDRQALRVSVSYDTPYARRQHEDVRLRHNGGRRAKWLELTWREQSQRALDYLAASIRRVM
jgi:hypothetical protein